MEDTKAISPQVKGLFETIRKQAKEYSQAFEYIESERNILLKLQDELVALAVRMKQQVDTSILDLNKNFEDAISNIFYKIEKINIIYEEIDNIRLLKDSLSNIDLSFKKQVSEINLFINEYKTKIDSELEQMLSTIKSKVEKEVETETLRIETKVTLKIRQIEGQILSFDQKIWSNNYAINRDLKSLNNEFSLLNNEFKTIKESLSDTNKLIKDEAEKLIIKYSSAFSNSYESNSNLIYRDLNSDVFKESSNIQEPMMKSKSRISMNEIDDFSLKKLSNEIESNLKKYLESELRKIKKGYDDEKKEFLKVGKKVNIVLIIAILALICSLIAVIIK